MSQHRPSRLGAPLCSIPLAPLLLVVLTVGLGSGCYQGEWRLGVEVPVATTNRLVPTRDIERWELVTSTVPNVIQVKATASQRCRYALYGTTRRTDTGRFKRIGGGWWSALAIATGVAGGAAGGFGAGGWFSNLYPDWGRPAMYGAGGAITAAGLASCIAALAGPSKLRFAFCGILVGLGGSVLAGAGISSVPAPGSTGATPASPGFMPLIDTNTFRTLTFAGAGLVGASIFSGIIAGTWRDYIDRERTVDNESSQSWDPQTNEQACGAPRALAGRVAALEITSEKLTEGLGSDVSPLKIRIAMGGQQQQAVDLRTLRHAIPSCGALRVQIAPDIVYEPYTEDYVPPVPPDQINPSARPIHGIIEPRDGVWLAASSADRRPLPKKAAVVPGVSPEVLAAMERRCAGEQTPAVAQSPTADEDAQASAPPAPVQAPRRPPSRPKAPPPPPPPVEQEPATPAAPSSPEQSAGSEGQYTPTPGLPPPRRQLARTDEGECSTDAAQARFADCEHQCGRALELSSCLFTFRKCHINARGSAQPQKERESCDLAWEQCLFTANVAPGSWRRCVDGCVQANEPPACKNKN